MYKQRLYNINTDHIDTKEVKKNNRYKNITMDTIKI